MAIIKRPTETPDHHRSPGGPVGFLRRMSNQSTILFGVAGILFGVGVLIAMQPDQTAQQEETPVASWPYYTPNAPSQPSSRPSLNAEDPAWTRNATIISRDITADERIRHRGPLVIVGAIGADAKIRVNNGPLLIKGDVGSGAEIRVTGHRLFWRKDWQSGWGDDWQQTWDNNWDAFKKDIDDWRSGNFRNRQASLTIDGKVGSDVKLKSDHAIRIKDAGADLNAHAGRSFTGGRVGEDSEIVAGNGIILGATGDDSKVIAGHSITTDEIGAGSKVRAGHSIDAGHIEEDSDVVAGHSINALFFAADVKATAGHAIRAEGADPSATLNAGHRVTIGEKTQDKARVKPAHEAAEEISL